MKSGFYKNNMSGEMSYKSFYPTPFQELGSIGLDFRTIKLLTKANFELGRLDGLASNIVDINMFLESYVRKEALYSSQLKGNTIFWHFLLCLSFNCFKFNQFLFCHIF